MNRFSLVTLLGLGIAQLAACGGDSSDDGAGGSGNAGSAGSAASAGSAGSAGSAATGGAGGTLNSTRKCGDGALCGDGAICEYTGIESGIRCTCDPSGHFLCDSFASAGAPSFWPCNETSGPYPGAGGASDEPYTCSHSNGHCTRTCTGGVCEITCDGSGVEDPDAGEECSPAYCDGSYNGYGHCQISDGTCDYKIDCAEPGVVASITGTCE
ncbi:MAG: hypothetical protein R3B07_32600 [Polyangiaceae bacterium]